MIVQADETPRQKAQQIVDRVSSALSRSHRRRAPGLLDLIFRRVPIEIDALLLYTIRGQAAVSMNPARQLIIRPRGDPALVRYLSQTLNGAGSWDARQRGWRIAEDESVQVLTRIIADRTPIIERQRENTHSAAAPRPTSIVIYSRYGMATGERLGDAITIRVSDGRLRAALVQQCPCGIYEDDGNIGLWRIAEDELDIAKAWADTLR